jgi:xylitol oxidase
MPATLATRVEKLEYQSNWSRNIRYRAARWHWPETVAQLQELVRACRKVRMLGSRHSFNAIADSREDLISLDHFVPQADIDRERRTVTVNANVKYGQLCSHLNRAGFGLHNMASLPHISVAGACATATHGSGDRNGVLATAVSAMEFVTGDGEIVSLSREQNPDEFDGMVVSLGGLGAVTRLTLNLLPAFEMRQDVYENLPFAHLAENFEAILSSAYSVSLFTDWRGPRINQVWVKRQITGDTPELAPDFYGAPRATGPLHPIARLSAEWCTEQLGRPGPWHERLPHFRMDFTPSNGEELQTEYMVPRPQALAAIQAVDRLGNRIATLLQISELRTIAADNLWMSPCYRQACLAIHFTWVKDWPAVQKLLPIIEDELAPFSARPHWGKLFTMPPARLQSLYPKLPDFRHLLERYDPAGKFSNLFLETCGIR